MLRVALRRVGLLVFLAVSRLKRNPGLQPVHLGEVSQAGEPRLCLSDSTISWRDLGVTYAARALGPRLREHSDQFLLSIS